MSMAEIEGVSLEELKAFLAKKQKKEGKSKEAAIKRARLFPSIVVNPEEPVQLTTKAGSKAWAVKVKCASCAAPWGDAGSKGSGYRYVSDLHTRSLCDTCQQKAVETKKAATIEVRKALRAKSPGEIENILNEIQKK